MGRNPCLPAGWLYFVMVFVAVRFQVSRPKMCLLALSLGCCRNTQARADTRPTQTVLGPLPGRFRNENGKEW